MIAIFVQNIAWQTSCHQAVESVWLRGPKGSVKCLESLSSKVLHKFIAAATWNYGCHYGYIALLFIFSCYICLLQLLNVVTLTAIQTGSTWLFLTYMF